VVAPELLVLLAEDVRPDVVGRRVIGNRREELDRQAGPRTPSAIRSRQSEWISPER
jgi:hypothetical protein